MQDLINKLSKNLAQRRSYLKRWNIEAFRVYDRDIPEHPYVIDVYGNQAVLWIRGLDEEIGQERENAKLPLLPDLLQEALKVEKVHIKKRQKMHGEQQYTRIENSNNYFSINEFGLKYQVNLQDYLDTGLFLDHRPLRQKMKTGLGGKKFLNLFCYTGSVSVAAASGGSMCTSVDMSNNYLDWAQRNFFENQLMGHRFVRNDVLQWLNEAPPEYYDVIFCDPPSFSNSKKMGGNWDVQRDHAALIKLMLKCWMAPDGLILFSTNLRSFKWDESSNLNAKDITESSIPPDFRDQKIHRLFEVRA